MIQSMTGYGKAALLQNGKTIKAEIRSLNGKFLDLNLRLPFSIKDKEMEIRSLIAEQLQRGKIDLSISIEAAADENNTTIDRALAGRYYTELLSLSKELHAGKKNLLELVLQMPNVMGPEKNINTEEAVAPMLQTVREAVKDLQEFRRKDGAGLEKIFRENIAAILSLLSQVETHERERVGLIQTKLRNQLSELVAAEEYDRNRFEQELIYYLERIDFSEEKVRLRSHCDYFLKVMTENESNGRKLNFISQEMGREINTLGSKANHATIQKLVVQMKDELEKIKEQLLNVL